MAVNTLRQQRAGERGGGGGGGGRRREDEGALKRQIWVLGSSETDVRLIGMGRGSRIDWVETFILPLLWDRCFISIYFSIQHVHHTEHLQGSNSATRVDWLRT